MWPQTTELTVFASTVEYLWRQRDTYSLPVPTDQRPWACDLRRAPRPALTTVLAEVLDPDPTGWP